jgi:hypothetical protein
MTVKTLLLCCLLSFAIFVIGVVVWNFFTTFQPR